MFTKENLKDDGYPFVVGFVVGDLAGGSSACSDPLYHCAYTLEGAAMRKGAWKHKLPTQFIGLSNPDVDRPRFTRRKGCGYLPALRNNLPEWNQDQKTRGEWRLNYPRGRGLFTARENQQAINKYFNSRNSRRDTRWAEAILWRKT